MVVAFVVFVAALIGMRLLIVGTKKAGAEADAEADGDAVPGDGQLGLAADALLVFGGGAAGLAVFAAIALAY